MMSYGFYCKCIVLYAQNLLLLNQQVSATLRLREPNRSFLLYPLFAGAVYIATCLPTNLQMKHVYPLSQR